MAKPRFQEGQAVSVKHVGDGVFGVKEMLGIYRGKSTIDEEINGEKVVLTTLHIDATWPYGNGNSRQMDFAASDMLLCAPVREWRVQEVRQ